MTISAQTIRKMGIITPFNERTVFGGMSYGLSICGYDIRIAQSLIMNGGEHMRFRLASTIEHFSMPNNVMGRVCDKSTWARRGLAVQNTIIEPGWRGYLTLELSANSPSFLNIEKGMPIAQVTFEFLDEPAEKVYSGKYQDQENRPVEAKLEVGE